MIPSLSECNPGLKPVEYNILVAAETVSDKIGSILLPDRAKDTEAHAKIQGLLVAMSPLAFNFDEWPADAQHERPKPGDIVVFGKYAGILIKGNDGREYRLIKDKDVAAVVEEGAKIALAA